MSERKHSWGPLYETMKELDNAGDTDYKDETLHKGFQLFKDLDDVYTYKSWDPLVAIIEALAKAALTSYEQNKLNSLCLDGILLTYEKNNPFNEIIVNYPKYIDTFLYYLEKFEVTEPTLLLLASTGRVELFNCLRAEHLNIYSDRGRSPYFSGYICVSITYIMFEQACSCGHLELAKTIFDTQKLDKKYIFCDRLCELYKYPDIVEFLLEKNIKLSSDDSINIMNWAFDNACIRGQIDIVKKFLAYDKIRIHNYTVTIAINTNNCELVELLLKCKEKYIKNDISYRPFTTNSLEISELLTKYEMKNEYKKKN